MYSIFTEEAASFVHTSQDTNTEPGKFWNKSNEKGKKTLVDKSERTSKFVKFTTCEKEKKKTD